eukprot:CAMPEP_0194145604 /NCGR_PEP_ID=MMETSP0152-20130528/17759_1 /TAXON_ID=1049557 /ORGANISM="Thalassiothrix antarctica, Strain L6-D1" /LENGTH=228 /DNA_ID=CAMNT_0038845883 /DNA_START=71 /DNA_END=757 /DNA_ORIENTATION=-
MIRSFSLFFALFAAANGFLVPFSNLLKQQIQHDYSLALLMASEAVEEIEMDAEDRMNKSVENVKQNLISISTGRASANMLDRVEVEYYGAMTPLNQMASISVPSAQQLTIDPYDKTIIDAVERSIYESNLGLTPNNDGNVIRINIPSLTEERRKDLMKQVKAMGEEGKVAIRNIRRDCVDGIKKLEKKSEIGEDQAKDGLDAMQKFTDKSTKGIDSIVSKKEKEVMTI